MEEKKEHEFAHFQGKEAIQHIAEVQAEGKWISSEIHGVETPGVLFAACDALRETVIACLLLIALLSQFEFAFEQYLSIILAFCVGWIFWKISRAAWLAWSRLERLHRVMDEERHEIETNREQERQELKALYAAKGFQGKLLDDVVDVLMADGDRLLRVMLEEEMGFRLQQNEHPLMQGLGAGIGAFIAALAMIGSLTLFPNSITLVLGAFLLSIASFYTSKWERNNAIAAIVWNIGIAVFVYCVAYYLMRSILG